VSRKTLAAAGAIWICFNSAPASPQPKSYEDFLADVQRMKQEWPGTVERKLKVVSEHCANAGTPAQVLSPQVLYRGSVQSEAVSNAGAVAVADMSKNLVLVFPNADSRETPLQIPLGRGLLVGSLSFSEDGRYLAWASVFEAYVYDLAEQRFALTLNSFEAKGVEWIGDDLLLVGNDNADMKVTTTSLFRLSDGEFHGEVLDTLIFGKGHVTAGAPTPPTPWVEDGFAISDQLGKSFLSGDKVYPSLTEALHDHKEILLQGQLNGHPIRVGEHLVQFGDNENSFRKPEMPWSLLLRDGTSGKILASIPYSMPWCSARQLAVASDNSKIAMLIGTSVLILKPTDLSVLAVYGLDATSVALPVDVAFAPNNTVIVWDQSLDPGHEAVLVYKLKD
jgi:hypothetical protein